MRALPAAHQVGVTPTVLLLHGEFADASCWEGVIPALQDAGIEVAAPANPLRGLAADAAYLTGLTREIDGPVLLVGHSYGGAVITACGAATSNIVGLVYVAAFALDAGESSLDLISRFPGSHLLPALRPATAVNVGREPEVELYIRADAFPQVYAADLTPRAATALAAGQRPIAAAAFEERLSCAAWRELPCWYVIATADRAIPAEAQRFMARRAGAQVLEVEASHAITRSQPQPIADLIRRAVTCRDHGGAHDCR